MWKLFGHFKRFLIYSNFLIALAAVAQCWLSYIILDASPKASVILIEFLCTFLLYTLMSFLSKPIGLSTSSNEKVKWFFQHVKFIYALCLLFIVLLIVALFSLKWSTIFFLGILGLLSITYGLPIFNFKGRKVGLRQFAGVKLFYIAAIWTMSGVGLPVVDLWSFGFQMDWGVISYLVITKMLFLLATTLPFDIRDAKQDTIYHTKTIPVLLGVDISKRICYGLFSIHIALVGIGPYSVDVKLGLVISSLIGIVLLRFWVFRSLANYNTVYILDLLLILQCLIVFVCVK